MASLDPALVFVLGIFSLGFEPVVADLVETVLLVGTAVVDPISVGFGGEVGTEIWSSLSYVIGFVLEGVRFNWF